jgi:hypothetical protein
VNFNKKAADNPATTMISVFIWTKAPLREQMGARFGGIWRARP